MDVVFTAALALGLAAQDATSTQPDVISDYTVGMARPVISSTYDMHPQIQVLPSDPYSGLVPFHRTEIKEGELGDEKGREFVPRPKAPATRQYGGFEGTEQTPWRPPDPSIAVGPDHVLETVNMNIAWWSKADSTLQFSTRLDSTGNPGFFEDVGAGNFTFDPKCLYDEHSGRFFVLALEVYGSNQAWITIAVSDDSDPNGTWYKYRTNAVTRVSGNDYWVDYPGLGTHPDAFVITGNLFRLGGGGFAGVKYRIFDKTPLLTGSTAVYFDLRDGSSASAQVAHLHSTGGDPYIVSVDDSNEIKIQAIEDPVTSPSIVTTSVNVDSFSSPGNCPTRGAGSIDCLDGRIMNVYKRGKKLLAGHGVDHNGDGESKAVARWYEFDVNNWPTSGSVTLDQQGNVNLGSGVYSFFPALAKNTDKDIAMVFARGASSEYPSIWYARHELGDAPGVMKDVTELKAGVSGYDESRWGDYFDVAVDPEDDRMIWAVGEFARTKRSWSTWIGPLGFTDATVSYIEPGCAGDGGLIPLLEVTLAKLGEQQDITTSNSVGGLPFYLVIGLSETSFKLRGCDIYASFPWVMVGPLILNGAPTPGAGNLTLSFPVPCDPKLVGLEIVMQSLILDPAAPLGLATTRGAKVKFGDR